MTIVEKIAFALGGDPKQEREWNIACEEALSILRILRDPTDGQIKAAVERVDYDMEGGALLGGASEAVHNAWVAMIDSALGGE
jgi:hypothetical protein